MAISWGATSGNFRIGFELAGTTLSLYAESVGYGHDFSSAIVWGGVWAGSANTGYTFYSGFGATVRKLIGSWPVTKSGTYTASTSYWNGSASCSLNVTLGSPPGAPTITSITKSDGKYHINFTKGSEASTTTIQWSVNGGAWYGSVNTTGTQLSSGLSDNNWVRVRLYSSNSVGNSAYSTVETIYTPPKVADKPTLSSGKKVSWINRGSYVTGFKVQRTDNGGATVTTVTTHSALTGVSPGNSFSWTDSNPQTPNTQYRVQTLGGTSTTLGVAESAWSAWSETAMDIIYSPPAITKLTAQRCTSTGQLTANGTYFKLASAGTATEVKNAAGTHLNKVTRKFAYRLAGSGGAWKETPVVTGINAANWDDGAGTAQGANEIELANSYEVRYTVFDTYTPTPVEKVVTIGTAAVPFSISKSGVGVGKVWERGALDVTGDIYINGFGLTVFDDTRNEMNPPSWYQSNFPRGEYSEWKGVTITGVPKPSGANFGILRTTVPWSYYNSGWPILQTYDASNGSETWRLWRASSSETTWGPWEGIGPNIQIIEGVAYQKQGHISSIPQTPAYTEFGSTYARTVTLSMPYTPPTGWAFRFWAAVSSGNTSVENAGATTGTVRIIQVGSNIVTALSRIGWELVKH